MAEPNPQPEFVVITSNPTRTGIIETRIAVIEPNPVRDAEFTSPLILPSGGAPNPARTGSYAFPLDLVYPLVNAIGPAVTPKFQLLVFDTSGTLVVAIQDALSGSFEDIINGGSGQGSFVVPRSFVDVGWINYNYRVQFYLQDSIDPWYDGYVIEIDQTQADQSSDRETVTIQTDGWQTFMSRSIVTETLSPGVQPNGTDNGIEYADEYLIHLLSTYLDSDHFRSSFISTIQFGLDKLTFDGSGLDDCVNQVVKQVLDETGNLYEWWCRGVRNGLPGIVIQPQQNPSKQPSGYYTPTRVLTNQYFAEFKDATIYGYTIQNSAQNLYNLIALYGGQDPVTGQQLYGPFKDSTSISLYGLSEKSVTDSSLLSQQSLQNYATAYLLLNGYPQPQGQFTKWAATDYARAGQWFQIHEPGLNATAGIWYLGTNADNLVELSNTHPGNIKQVRAVRVVTIFGQSGQDDRVEQQVYTTAPRPFIDHAYYSAVAQSKGNAAITTLTKPTSQLVNYFLKSGMNYVGNNNGVTPPTVTFDPPSGFFNSNTLVALGGGNITVQLKDSASGATGPGVYTVVFTDNELTQFGAGTNGPAIHVVKGVPPTNSHILLGHRFTVT